MAAAAMRRIAITVLCVLLTTAAACRAGADNEGAGGTPTVALQAPSVEFVSAAAQAARDTLLTSADVPPDWLFEPGEPSAPPPRDFPPECAYLTEVDVGFPGQVAFAAGGALIGPAYGIKTEASVFASHSAAHESLSKWFATFAGCRDEIIEFVRRASDFAPDDRLDYREIDVPQVGEESRGVRIEYASADVQEVVDFVYVRQGRIIATLMLEAGAPEEAERDRYVRVLAEKARAADEALPD